MISEELEEKLNMIDKELEEMKAELVELLASVTLQQAVIKDCLVYTRKLCFLNKGDKPNE